MAKRLFEEDAMSIEGAPEILRAPVGDLRVHVKDVNNQTRGQHFFWAYINACLNDQGYLS